MKQPDYLLRYQADKDKELLNGKKEKEKNSTQVPSGGKQG